MKGPWIKLWRKMLVDEKLQVLIEDHGDKAFRIWVTLLSVSCDGDVTEMRRVLASRVQANMEQLDTILNDMVELGMITLEDVKIKITNWDKYQECESKSRTRDYRKRHESVTGASQERHEVDPVTDRSIEDRSIEEEKKETAASAPASFFAVPESVEPEKGSEVIPSGALPPSGKPARKTSPPADHDPLRAFLQAVFLDKVKEFANWGKEGNNLTRLASVIRRKAAAIDVPPEEAARGTVETFWRLHETGKPFYSDFTPSKMLAILESLWGEWAKGKEASNMDWMATA